MIGAEAPAGHAGRRRAVFTVCAEHRLARATVLMEDAARYLPDHHQFLVVAAAHRPATPRRLPARCRVVTSAELAIADFDVRRRVCDAAELCASIKPEGFHRLFGRGYEEVLYLDPEMALFAAPEEIGAAWPAGDDIALVPHLMSARRHPDRALRAIGRGSRFSPGVLAMRRSAAAMEALAWWRSEAAAACVAEPAAGKFADQRTIDALADRFPGRRVVAHPGYGVADWNLHERPLSRPDTSFTAGAAPLVLFHFAGFDALRDDRDRRPEESDDAVLRIGRDYARRIVGNGELEIALRPYAYDRLGGGVRNSELVRRALRGTIAAGTSGIDADGLDRPDFLTRPVAAPGGAAGEAPIPRLLHLLVGRLDTPADLRREIAAWRDAVPAARKDRVGGLLLSLHRHGVADVRTLEALAGAGPAAELWPLPTDPDRDMLSGTRRVAVDGVPDAAALPVLLLFLHHVRPDLHERYALGTRQGLVGLVTWLLTQGAALYALADPVLEGMAATLDRPFADGGDSPLAAALARVLAPHAPAAADPEARDTAVLTAFLRGGSAVRPAVLTTVMRAWLWNPGSAGVPRIVRAFAANDALRAALPGPEPSPRATPAVIDVVLAARGLGRLRSKPADDPTSPGLPPHADARRLDLGPVVVGPFSGVSGLAASADRIVELLRGAMGEVTTIDFKADRAATLRLSDTRTRFLLLHVNADLTLDAVVKFRALWRHAERRIGYWYWELPEMDGRMAAAAALLDEVWVASEHVRRAVAAACPIPVRVIPPVIEPALYRPTNAGGGSFGAGKERFRFLAVLDSRSHVMRKNPGAVLRSFRKAFPQGDEPVELLVKLINGHHNAASFAEFHSSVAQDRRVRVIDGTLTQIEMNDLYQAADCFVSLHRAEGLGLGIVQAMMRGKAVIATGYSAPMDFMTAGNALLVPYATVPVAPDAYPGWLGQSWAAPDETAAAVYMRQVAGRPDIAAALGRRAAVDAERYFAPARIREILRREAGI